MKLILPISAALALLAAVPAQAQSPLSLPCAEAIWGKQFEQALTTCTNVLEDKSATRADRVLAHQARGTVLARSGKLDEALADLDAAVELNSNDPSLYNNRGSVNLRLGQVDKAIADFTAALEADPDYLRALHNRGIAHARNDDYAKAIADFDETIEAAPDYFPAYYNRGVAHQKHGKVELAATDFRKVLELRPETKAARDKLKELGVPQ